MLNTVLWIVQLLLDLFLIAWIVNPEGPKSSN